VSPQDMNIVTVVASAEEAIPVIREAFERFTQER